MDDDSSSSNEAPFGPLAGLRLCVTGCSASEERRIDTAAKALGAKLQPNLDDSISCLLVCKVGTIKYKAAKKMGMPTATMDWIFDCKKQKTRLPYAAYAEKPFHGLVVGCTQVTIESGARVELQAIIEAGGGTFVKELVKDSLTHLVAERPEGDKFAAATVWKKIVVSPGWVRECAKMKRWIHEQPYLIVKLPEGGGVIRSSTTTAPTSSVPAATPASTPAAASSSSSSSSSPSSSKPPRKAQPPSFLWDDLPDPSSVHPSRRSLLQHDVFFVSGFAAEQRDYVVRLVLAGGGARHHVLTAGVTKVLCGKDADRKLLLEVKRHPTSPPCLRVEWLVDLLIPGALEDRRLARAEKEREREREEMERIAREEEAAREREREREMEREKEREVEREKEREREQERERVRVSEMVLERGWAAQENEEAGERERANNVERTGSAEVKELNTTGRDKENTRGAHPNSPNNAPTQAGPLLKAPPPPAAPSASQSFEESFIQQHSRSRSSRASSSRALRGAMGGVDGEGEGDDGDEESAVAGARVPGNRSLRCGPSLRAEVGPDLASGGITALAGLKRPSRPAEIEWRVREVTGDSLELDHMHGAACDGFGNGHGHGRGDACMRMPVGRVKKGRASLEMPRELFRPEESQIVTWDEDTHPQS